MKQKLFNITHHKLHFNDLNLDMNKKFHKGYSHAHIFSDVPEIDVNYLNIPYFLYNNRLAESIDRKGVKLNLFTINSRKVYTQFVNKGLNAFYTDRPLMFM